MKEKLKILIFILLFNINSKDLCVGLCFDQGKRKYMEDRYRIINRPETEEYFFGIFDGHGGSKVSDYLANILHPIFLENLENFEIPQALINSHEFIDKELDPTISNQGSTSLVTVIKNEKLYVSNVGYSRAVLCRNGKAVDLSIDHTTMREDEIKRIQKMGGNIYYPIKTVDGSIIRWSKIINNIQFVNSKTFNILNVDFEILNLEHARVFNKENYSSIMTRVIGDKFIKDVLIATPEITITDILPEDEFMIMASKGIWNFISSQFAVDKIKNELESGSSVHEAADTLRAYTKIPTSLKL